jgi:hypothetical protein
VIVPDLDEISPEQIGDFIQLARLLRGEEVRTTWPEITMTRSASGDRSFLQAIVALSRAMSARSFTSTSSSAVCWRMRGRPAAAERRCEA